MWTFSLMMGRKDNIQHLKCAVHLPTAVFFPLNSIGWCGCTAVPVRAETFQSSQLSGKPTLMCPERVINGF